MRSLLRRSLFFLALIGIWALVADRGIWNSALFPHPRAVLQSLAEVWNDGTLLDAIAVSLRRVIVGYLISLGLGVPLGILIARSKIAEETIGSLVTGFQALPSICWLPLALLWYGLNDRAILFVVVMGSLVSITVAVQDGVKNLPPTYLQAARMLGTRPLRQMVDVLIPASLPTILTGAKLGWSYAWRALMAGELLFVSLGLGHMLMMGRELADMARVLAVMVVIIALGLFTDGLIFGSLERLVRRRWGFDRA